jgi:heat shock protein 4
MDTDATNGEGEKKTRKVKKQVRKGELPISSGTGALEEATKNAWTEKENAMSMEDKLVADSDEKKNELESYIYELRDKIETTYAEFSSEEEKEKLRAKLTDSEVRISFPNKQKKVLCINADLCLGLAVRGR